MDKDFNKRVFESFPDSVWTGEVPVAQEQTQHKTIWHAARYALQAAAAACIVFSAVTLVRMARQADEPAAPVAQAVPAQIVYRVNDAVQASMELPDGSTVTLNCGSTLTLAEGFGTQNRTASLDGEALFEVAPNRQMPFVVNTPQGVEVKVTGTRFNVSCYSNNGLFDLTLLQGSVEVTTRKKEVLHVKPSEQLLIKDDFLNLSEKNEPREALEWTEGILRFNGTPMREAIGRIEKWYGVQVVAEDDAVYRNSISGTFKSEPLEEVLHLICLTSRLEYSLQDKTVTIRSRK